MKKEKIINEIKWILYVIFKTIFLSKISIIAFVIWVLFFWNFSNLFVYFLVIILYLLITLLLIFTPNISKIQKYYDELSPKKKIIHYTIGIIFIILMILDILKVIDLPFLF